MDLKRLRGRMLAAVVTVLLGLVGTVSVSTPAFAHTATISQGTAEGILRNGSVTWSSSGGCSYRYNSSCTSFDQIRHSTVEGAVALRQSGCAVNITGGTEVGHSSGTYSHFNGWKIDITKYTCITNYIHRFSYIGLRGDGAPMYRSGSGNVYADEGSHWDLTLYSCGCSFD